MKPEDPTPEDEDEQLPEKPEIDDGFTFYDVPLEECLGWWRVDGAGFPGLDAVLARHGRKPPMRPIKPPVTDGD